MEWSGGRRPFHWRMTIDDWLLLKKDAISFHLGDLIRLCSGRRLWLWSYMKKQSQILPPGARSTRSHNDWLVWIRVFVPLCPFEFLRACLVAKYLLKNVKNCQNLSNFIKFAQNGVNSCQKIQIVLYRRERRDRGVKRIVFFEKTKPIRRPSAGNSTTPVSLPDACCPAVYRKSKTYKRNDCAKQSQFLLRQIIVGTYVEKGYGDIANDRLR